MSCDFTLEHYRQILENALEALQSRMADPDFYQEDRETIASAQNELARTEEELTQCYERWETLEAEKGV